MIKSDYDIEYTSCDKYSEMHNQLIKVFFETMKTDTKESYLSFMDKLNIFINKYFSENKIETIKPLTHDEKILDRMEKCVTHLETLTSVDDILYYLKSKELIDKFSGQNSSYILLNKDYIINKRVKMDSNGKLLFKNEVNTLLKLNSEKHFPDLLAIDKNRGDIYMKYCGKLINSDNKPKNWLEQYEEIKTILFKHKISPSDIQLKNICVLNNIIYLIDFGFGHVGTKAELVRDLTILYNVLYRL